LFADRHAAVAGPHQGAIDLQPRRVAERFQAGGGVADFHDVKLSN
jgi:hypothetical protein